MKDKKYQGEGLNVYGNQKLTARRNMDGSVRGSEKMTPDEMAKHLRRESDRDSEMVTGRFRNLERRGRAQDFGVKLHDWAYWRSTLMDGQVYTLPRGIARFINQQCFTKKYANLKDSEKVFGSNSVIAGHTSGTPMANDHLQVIEKVHRFAFDPINFGGDTDILRNEIVEVGYK